MLLSRPLSEDELSEYRLHLGEALTAGAGPEARGRAKTRSDRARLSADGTA